MNTATIEAPPSVHAAPTAEPQDIADITAGRAVVKLSATEAGLAVLRADLAGRTYDLATSKGNDAARADRQRCVKLRTALEAKRKSLKAPALEFGRLIDAEAKRITDEVLKLEAPIDAAIKADEERRERERLERERIEAARIAGLMAEADNILAGWLARCEVGGMTADRIDAGLIALGKLQVPENLADVAPHWAQQQAATVAAMGTKRDAARRREEAEALAKERAEQKRIADELAAQRAELAAQASAQKAEADRLERERQALAAAQLHAMAGVEEAAQNTEGQDSQQVLKAEPATADATDRDVPANTSPRVGAMGEGQAADAAPAGGFVMFVHVDDSKSLMAELTAPTEVPAGVKLIRGEVGHVDCGIRIAPEPFTLTPDATDLLGDAATPPAQIIEQAARALLGHIAEAFTGRFPSDPKPGRAWFATLKDLASNLNDAI